MRSSALRAGIEDGELSRRLKPPATTVRPPGENLRESSQFELFIQRDNGAATLQGDNGGAANPGITVHARSKRTVTPSAARYARRPACRAAFARCSERTAW